MMQHIMVPIDGSAVANRALAFAIERAKIHNAQITVAFAVNRLSVAMATATPYTHVDPTPLLEALDAEANAVLDAGESLVESARISHKRAKLDGTAASAILNCAKETKPDCIVMGTSGRRGFERIALGSTAEGVIRASGVPVFVVPAQSEAVSAGPLTHALVAVDGSPAAAEAVKLACALSHAERTRLTLCTVVEPGTHWDDLDRSVFLQEEMEAAAARLLEESRALAASLGVAAEKLLREGQAARDILSCAHDVSADLIVMGTHGRAGIPRFILGSVAESVLRSSRLPVCTVRHR